MAVTAREVAQLIAQLNQLLVLTQQSDALMRLQDSVLDALTEAVKELGTRVELLEEYTRERLEAVERRL
jgi:hypothetical protein